MPLLADFLGVYYEFRATNHAIGRDEKHEIRGWGREKILRNNDGVFNTIAYWLDWTRTRLLVLVGWYRHDGTSTVERLVQFLADSCHYPLLLSDMDIQL